MMRRALGGAGVVLMLSACAARVPLRPVGTVAPDSGALDAFVSATRACRGLRTLTAELSISGHAGGERLRGRVLTGLETGGAVRMEGLAPFGPPMFILAGRHEEATLLLPRDRRVLAATGVAQILERLTGLALGADDLRLILSGCLADGVSPSDGRRWGNGWRAVALGADRVAYLRERQGAHVVVAADHGPWQVEYTDHLNGWPRTVRVRRAGNASVDLTARIAQLEVNVPIDERAFAIEVPADALAMTLDDLRSVAPLVPKAPDGPGTFSPSHLGTAHRRTSAPSYLRIFE